LGGFEAVAISGESLGQPEIPSGACGDGGGLDEFGGGLGLAGFDQRAGIEQVCVGAGLLRSDGRELLLNFDQSDLRESVVESLPGFVECGGV
jgi:hypothetical protein